MPKKIKIEILFFTLLFFSACLPVRDVSNVNMAGDYRQNENNFHPEFIAFNHPDSFVKLYVKLFPGEFLFVRQPDDKFRSFIRIHADIIESYESSKVIDSSSAEFSFELSDKDIEKILSFNIPAHSEGVYLIHIVVSDNNKNSSDDFYVPLDRLSKPSRNDFLVLNKNNVPYFRNYFYSNDTVIINYRDSTLNNFTCNFYNRDFPLAAPPFSFDVHDDFDYHPDSIFNCNKNDLKQMEFPQEGFYHFRTDSVSKTGLTLFRFPGGFPDVTNPKQMIEAIRYLTNKKEYEEMKTSTSPKAMIDNFWLTHGGTEEKSRNLIKKYYGRVRDANKYFSSYTEGWRTDRGMIYIIFGSPGTIYKSSETESWIYGTPNSSLALNFFFIKVNNPFSDNDFTLSRSPSYESNWYRAVEIWRQGRAYNSFY